MVDSTYLERQTKNEDSMGYGLRNRFSLCGCSAIRVLAPSTVGTSKNHARINRIRANNKKILRKVPIMQASNVVVRVRFKKDLFLIPNLVHGTVVARDVDNDALCVQWDLLNEKNWYSPDQLALVTQN